MNQAARQSDARSPDIDDPASAQASPDQWRSWVEGNAESGGQPLRTAGLAILLGLATAMLALVVFAYVADNVLDRETQQFDQNVLASIHQFSSPQFDTAAVVVSTFGNELIWLFSVLLLIGFGVQRRWGAAASLVLVVGGASLVNDILKTLVHRTRPSPVGATLLGQAYSFPSGHAMMSMAFYLFVGYLAWRLLDGWKRMLVILGLALVVLLVGLSRLYLEVHYPTDVLAGDLAGFIWTDTVLVGAHLLGRRRDRHRARTAAHAV